MRILCWNVNGFRSAWGKGLPEFVAAQSPDIICLQETKAGAEVLAQAQYQFPGYSGFHSVATKKGYSGVSSYFRRGHEPKQILHGIGKKVFDQEGRFVISQHNDFDLYNLYYPSGTSGDERQDFKYKFLDALYDYLSGLSSRERARSVLCGDFNICHREIDIHHPKTAAKQQLTGFLPEERAWMDKFAELGFVDTFRKVHGDVPNQYSWWSFRANSRAKNLGWRIDYIWVAGALAGKIRDASMFMEQRGSDHCPISADLALT